MEFDINLVMEKLRERKKIFYLECDFRQEMIITIKELYPTSIIEREAHVPNSRNRIDILVKLNDKYYPIELKYPTKKCHILFDNIEYELKNHGAQNEIKYDYLQDIEELENFRKFEDKFCKGYAILVTNDLSYEKEPTNKEVDYYNFSIHEGAEKTGTLMWKNGEKKGFEQPITLKEKYKMHWKEYSQLDNNITFKYLLNEIKR